MNTAVSILAVDDSVETLDLIQAELSRAGYSVRPADSGELALEAISLNAPDLILLDMRLPGMSGIEICRRLKEDAATRDIPVVLMSAYAEATEWSDGLRAGANDYVLKPFRAEELIHRVRTQFALADARIQNHKVMALESANRDLSEQITVARQTGESLRIDLNRSEEVRSAIATMLEEQKRTAEDLRRSEALFRRTFTEAPVGAALLRPDRSFIRVNDTFCRYLGYTEKELLALNLADITHPDDEPGALARTRQLIAGEVPAYDVEKRYRRKDGRLIWARVSMSLLRDENGQPLYLAPIIQDITARKHAEAEIQRSREQFAHILRTAVDGFWIVDENGRLTEVNEAACDMLGYKREELIGLTPSMIDVVDSQEDVRGRMALLRKQGKLRFESRQRRKDGRIIDVEVSCTFEERAGGPFFAFIRDITAEKKAFALLREREQTFTTLFHRAPLVMTLSDCDDGRYIQVNDAFVRTLGYSAEEAVGRTSSELGVTGQEQRSRILQQAQGSGRALEMAVNLKTKDGRILDFVTSVEIVVVEGVRYLLSASIEITEYNRLQTQLRHIQKMDAIGQLAGGVAHDFNNILASITLLCGLLHDNNGLDQETQSCLRDMENEAARGAAITRQLLAFSRQQVVTFRTLNLVELLTPMRNTLQRLLGERISVELQAPSQLPGIEGDASMLEQVIMNCERRAGSRRFLAVGKSPFLGSIFFPIPKNNVFFQWVVFLPPPLVLGVFGLGKS